MYRSKTILIQRVIPHYRVALFQHLWERYGVRVLTSANPQISNFLSIADPKTLEFTIPLNFHFTGKKDSRSPVMIPTFKALKRIEPEFVVAEFGLRLSSSYELVIARRLGILKGLAFWTHGLAQDPADRSISTKFGLQVARRLMAGADVLATYGEVGASYLKSNLPGPIIMALGNCLDGTNISAVQRQSMPVRLGKPQLLIVGRLTADKNVLWGIRIFAEIRKNFPEAHLTIIGDGPEMERAKQLATVVGGRILFTGDLHDESLLAPYFMGADLLLLCGAAGLSVNHALAYQLPVMAFQGTDSGPFHHPEIEYVIAERSGFLVEEYSIAAMAERAVEVLKAGAHENIRNKLKIDSVAPSMDQVVDRFGSLLSILDGLALVSARSHTL